MCLEECTGKCAVCSGKCAVGRVENGNHRVFKNLLAIIFCHLVYRFMITCKKKNGPKSFRGQEIDVKKGPDH